MADLQSSITKFLRDSLSGAQENASAANNALIVPIGRRTNLSMARQQINAAFDKAELAVGKLARVGLEDSSTPAKPTSIRAQRSYRKAFSHSHPSLIRAGISLALVEAANLVDQLGIAYAKVRETFSSVIKSLRQKAEAVVAWMSAKKEEIKKWAIEKWNTVKKWAEDTWDAMVERGKRFFSDVTQLALDGFAKIRSAVGDVAGAVEDGVKSWSREAATAMYDALNVSVPDSELPASEIPADALQKAWEAVRHMWSSMTAMVRDWLWSIFSNVTDRKANEAKSTSAPTASAPTSAPGSGEARAVVMPTFSSPAAGGSFPVGGGGGYRPGGGGGSPGGSGLVGSGGSSPGGSGIVADVDPGSRPGDAKYIPVAGGSGQYGHGDAGSAARTSIGMAVAMDELRKQGVPEVHVKAAAALLMGQALSESDLKPDTQHDKNGQGVYTGYGIYGAHLDRRDRMLDWLKRNGYAQNSLEGQVRYMAREAMILRDKNGELTSKEILMNATEGSLSTDSWRLESSFEGPKYLNNRAGATLRAMDTPPATVIVATPPTVTPKQESSAPDATATPQQQINPPADTPAQAQPVREESVPPASTPRAPAGPDDRGTDSESAPQAAAPPAPVRDSRVVKPHMINNDFGMMLIAASDYV